MWTEELACVLILVNTLEWTGFMKRFYISIDLSIYRLIDRLKCFPIIVILILFGPLKYVYGTVMSYLWQFLLLSWPDLSWKTYFFILTNTFHPNKQRKCNSHFIKNWLELLTCDSDIPFSFKVTSWDICLGYFSHIIGQKVIYNTLNSHSLFLHNTCAQQNKPQSHDVFSF